MTNPNELLIDGILNISHVYLTRVVSRGWVFSCLDCSFLVVVFLCLFNRANFHTHSTPYTNLLIDLRILKSFFVLIHRDCRLRTYRVACCATTTILFSCEKNWDWFVMFIVFIFLCLFRVYCGGLISIEHIALIESI